MGGIKQFLKMHPVLLSSCWSVARGILQFIGLFIPIKKNRMIFASFGGRSFNDSPKALYDEICQRSEFDDWDLVWAFTEPEKHIISRGRKVRIDTVAFFFDLLSAKVWVCNSGIDRGIGIKKNGIIKIETWHGAPLKKIGADAESGGMYTKKSTKRATTDNSTIRCAQSVYDRDINSRVFNATKDSFLMSGLPRNDELFGYTEEKIESIKKSLGIPHGTRVILYAPTYREYLVDSKYNTYIKPPLDFDNWAKNTGGAFILLVRAHYAVMRALDITSNEYVKDVSAYPSINDLYAISDGMISDYSSTFFDYSILERPMFCFAYDLEDYLKYRGLYKPLNEILPCKICHDQNELIGELLNANYDIPCEETISFKNVYVPNEGHASSTVVEELIRRLGA